MPADDAQPIENGDEASNNTQTIKIQGIEFTADMPYKEGHVLSKAESSVLNQVYGENLRNNFAPRIKKAKEEALAARTKEWQDAGGGGTAPTDESIAADKLSALRTEFEAYESEYEFNGRRSTRVGNPVEREAMKMARAKILERMKEKNIDPKTYPAEKMVELIGQLLEKNPKIREEAQRRVQAQKDIAEESMEMPDLAA